MRVRHVALAIAVLTTGTSLTAQGTAASPASSSGPSFGVIGAFNIANIRGDGADGDSRNGFAVGATALFRFSPTLALQPELLFTQKGTRVDADGLSGTLALSYLELPIQLRVDVPSSGTIRPYLLAGPYVAFRTGCSVRGGGVSVDCDDVADFIGENGGFKRVDYGLGVGGGIDFPLAGRTGTVLARYGFGLGDIADESSSRNRVIQFGFGIRF